MALVFDQFLLCKPHFFYIYAGGKFKLGARANCQSIANIPGENAKCTTDLLLNGSLDYEASAEYSLMVRLTDNQVTFTTQQLKIRS